MEQSSEGVKDLGDVADVEPVVVGVVVHGRPHLIDFDFVF